MRSSFEKDNAILANGVLLGDMQAARNSEEIISEIEHSLGYFPSFMLPAAKNAKVLDGMWQQMQSSYLETSLPVRFKEQLLAYLSKWCTIPYAIVSHSCTLYQLGMGARAIFDMLIEPSPLTFLQCRDITQRLSEELDAAVSWPQPESAFYTALYRAAIAIFLAPQHTQRCQEELRRLLGEKYHELVDFLAYVRAYHQWLELHREIDEHQDFRVHTLFAKMTSEERLLETLFENYQKYTSLGRDMHDNEQRYRRIVESAHEGIWEVDDKSRTKFVNKRMAEMLGYSVEEMLDRPIFEFTDEEGRRIAAENIERRKQGISGGHDAKFIRKNGEELWALINVNPWFDETGKFVGSVAMVSDITYKKAAEKERERLLHELQALTFNLKNLSQKEMDLKKI
jgi:two-component system, cell cycle sensor histidine kinase and response regulator CckA